MRSAGPAIGGYHVACFRNHIAHPRFARPKQIAHMWSFGNNWFMSTFIISKDLSWCSTRQRSRRSWSVVSDRCIWGSPDADGKCSLSSAMLLIEVSVMLSGLFYITFSRYISYHYASGTVRAHSSIVSEVLIHPNGFRQSAKRNQTHKDMTVPLDPILATFAAWSC